MSEKELCITCAWRGTCQKQFSLKAGQKCPEYSRDLALGGREQEAKGSGGQQQKK